MHYRPRRGFAALGVAIALALGATALTAGPAYAATSVTIKFDTPLGERTPDAFGGGINVLDEAADIDSLRGAGVPLTRRDFYLYEIVPAGTNIAAYTAAMNGPGMADDTGVANPANWDWSKYSWVSMYKNKGLRIIGIMSYGVGWLGDGTQHSYPTNMTVYADIVKKIYDRYKNELYAIEIWNEPNGEGFLHVDGNGKVVGTSPLLDPIDAYPNIYRAASAGIRSLGGLGATVPIGGPVTSAPAANWVTTLLTAPNIPAANINFLSYHYYQTNPDGEVAVDALTTAAVNAGRSDLPIYATEWNWTAAFNQDPMNNGSPDAIPYVAQRMDNFARKNAGATYFSMNKLPRDIDFYAVNADGSLTPKMRAWRLLAKQLGLGDGTFVFADGSWVNGAATVLAGGAANSAGKQVAWVINTAASGDTVNVTFQGLTPGNPYTAEVYEASASNDATAVRQTISFTTNSNGVATTSVTMPAKSVLGFRLTNNDPRVDLAAGKPVVVDSTFPSQTRMGQPFANFANTNLTDAKPNTRWASQPTGGNHCILIDLGSTQTFNRVEVAWNTAYGQDYTVQTSASGTCTTGTWTTTSTLTGNAGPGLRVHMWNPASTARYLRIVTTAAAPGYSLVSAYSVGVYRDIARGQTATQSSTFGPAYVASNGNDSDGATRFATAAGAGPHWWRVDFAAAATVRAVRIDWETAYATGYTIETLSGGVWTTRATVAATSPGWKVTGFPSVSNVTAVRVTATGTVPLIPLISAYSVEVF